MWFGSWDEVLFRLMNDWGTGFTGTFFGAITWWGHFALCGPALLLFAWIQRPQGWQNKLSALLGYTVVLGAVVVALKVTLDRPRPAALWGLDQLHIIGEPLLRRSFPSGHTATAAWVFFAALVLGLNRVALALFGALALLVGFSRVVVGAHFPSDVIAGWLFAGGTFLPFCVKQRSRLGEETDVQQPDDH